MVNMKDISEVPLLEQLTGKENVLLNDSGSAKQTSIEILFAETSKALVNANKKLEDSAKMIEGLNKKIEEMEELDIDIVVRSTWNEDEGNFIPEVEVNKMLTFEELKQKILAGTPLKIKSHLFSKSPNPNADDSYWAGSNAYIDCSYYPAGFRSDEQPEGIVLIIQGSNVSAFFYLEANNELILDNFHFN